MKRSKMESASILADFERINRQTLSINPTASVLNKGSLITGGLSAAKRMEEEDNDERFFINFAKRYFNVAN